MEIQSNQITFTTAFDVYKARFDELDEISESNVPNDIKMFDIRFRLALSAQIAFDSTISYTTTETTKKSYRLIYKLNDMWFAYESLYKLFQPAGYLKSDATKSDPFTVQKTIDLNLIDNVNSFIAFQNSDLLSVSQTKTDLIGYLNYLISNSKGKVITLIGSYINNINTPHNIEFNQILSVIYAMRNMYVHNTETAKSGVNSMNTKITYMKNCYDFLTLVNLKVATPILNMRINEIS